MTADARHSHHSDVDNAVELLDRLLETTDGGSNVVISQYEASTIIALLADDRYRARVLAKLPDFN